MAIVAGLHRHARALGLRHAVVVRRVVDLAAVGDDEASPWAVKSLSDDIHFNVFNNSYDRVYI
jgi:hypothetical protein